MSSITRKVWNVVIRIISDVKLITDNQPIVYDGKQSRHNSQDGLYVMLELLLSFRIGEGHIIFERNSESTNERSCVSPQGQSICLVKHYFYKYQHKDNFM
jgi:hypothetical protein